MGKQQSKWLDFGLESHQIHAGKMPVDYTPTNYTPVPVNEETDDKLSAHLKGLDTALSGAGLGTLTYYDSSVLVTTDIGVAGTGYNNSHTIFTLPNSETYNGTIDELLVFVNGIAWEDGVDFNYQNSTTATTITALTAIPKNSRVRFRKVSL